MKTVNFLSLTVTLVIVALLMAATFTTAAPIDGDRWEDGNIDDSLVQLVAKRLLNQMTNFERIRRTGLSARQGALSNFLKARVLSQKIRNPYGPGRRK